MITVSNGFLTAVKESSRTVDAKVRIGTITLTSDDIINYEVKSSLAVDDMPSIGNAISSSAKIEILNENLPQILTNVPIVISGGVEVNGSMEWITIGTFYTTNDYVTRGKMKTTIECFDSMYFYNDIEYDTSYNYPKTVNDMFDEMEVNHSLLRVGNVIPNVDYPVNPTYDKLSLRAVLSNIAFLCGTNIVSSRFGNQVEFLHSTVTNFTLDGDNYIDFNRTSDSPVTIRRLKVTNPNTSEVYISGANMDIGVTTSRNVATSQAQVDVIASRNLPFTYKPYTLELQGMPHIRVGDIIQLTLTDGTIEDLIVMNHALTYNGGFKSEFSANAPAKEVVESTVFDNANTTVTGNIEKRYKLDLQQAIQESTDLITGATGGNVITVVNAQGEPIEQVIIDTNDITTAQNVWRWNINGLGFSSNGYNGQYELAITADGKIVADFISADTLSAITANLGVVNAGRVQSADGASYWDLNTGEIVINATSIKVGVHPVVTEDELQSVLEDVIVDVDIEYANGSSETSSPETGWSTTPPPWEADKYIWSRTKTVYKDTSTSYTNPVNISGAKGADGSSGSDGSDGSDGRSVTGIVEEYYHSTSPTSLFGDTWGEEPPTWEEGRFVWTRSKITYANPSGTHTTDPISVSGSKGEKGIDGQKGDDGTSVSSIIEYYLATSESSDITNTSSGFTDTPQKITSTKKYLWNFEQVNFSDGNNSRTQAVIIGVYGDKGIDGSSGSDGSDGRSIISVTEYYLASTESSGVSRSTDGWTTGTQVTTPSEKYLWNYTKIAWSSGTLETFAEPVIIGIHGDKGDKGDSGISISSVDVQYQNSTSSTIAPTGTWSTTANWEVNKFTWSRVKTSYSSGDPTYSDPAVITGAKGDKGDEGATGKGILSTEITYQASVSGTSTPTGSWVATIPNVAENQFLWTRTTITYTDNQVDHAYSVGKMGAKGTTGNDGNDGNDGRGISSTVITYQVSTSGTAIPSSWQPSIPTVAENEFLWTRTTINYTSGNPTHAYSVGKMGAKGDKGTTGSTGATGRGISSIIEEYYLSDSKTTQTGSSWKLSPDPWVINKYMWTRSKINYTTGLPAFEYTKPLVSSEWEAINEIEIGGRNLAKYDNWLISNGEAIGNHTFVLNATTSSSNIRQQGDSLELEPNTDYVFSFRVRKLSGDFNKIGGHTTPNFITESTTYIDGVDVGYRFPSAVIHAPLNDGEWHKVVVYLKSADTILDTGMLYIQPNRSTYEAVSVEIKDLMFERGNKATDWMPSPEDVEASIGEKANNSDLNNLGVIVGDLSSELSSKADEGELTSLINRYNDRIEEEIINKQEVSNALSTLEGRTNAVEYTLGQKTAKWDFIETTITKSEEGIFIGNEGTQMGVLVGTDRISFMDKGIEVAYISNKTMQINHGIFVESAIIGKHMIETISGTDITVFTYIG